MGVSECVCPWQDQRDYHFHTAKQGVKMQASGNSKRRGSSEGRAVGGVRKVGGRWGMNRRDDSAGAWKR